MKFAHFLRLIALAVFGILGISCSTTSGGREYQRGYSGSGSAQQSSATWQDELFRSTGY